MFFNVTWEATLQDQGEVAFEGEKLEFGNFEQWGGREVEYLQGSTIKNSQTWKQFQPRICSWGKMFEIGKCVWFYYF